SVNPESSGYRKPDCGNRKWIIGTSAFQLFESQSSSVCPIPVSFQIGFPHTSSLSFLLALSGFRFPVSEIFFIFLSTAQQGFVQIQKNLRTAYETSTQDRAGAREWLYHRHEMESGPVELPRLRERNRCRACCPQRLDAGAGHLRPRRIQRRR